MLADLATLTAEARSRLAPLGFELVDIRTGGTPNRTRLQIRIDWLEQTPGRGITVEDCATASRALEQWLDEVGILGPRYILEVSSPGIERPVRWREHWERFAGREVNARVRGHGRLRARILRVLEDGNAVVLQPSDGGEELTIPLAEIREATLAVDWDSETRKS